jgi:hypothetical protein
MVNTIDVHNGDMYVSHCNAFHSKFNIPFKEQHYILLIVTYDLAKQHPEYLILAETDKYTNSKWNEEDAAHINRAEEAVNIHTAVLCI